MGESVLHAMRNRFNGARMRARKGVAGWGRANGSPGSGPLSTSSAKAVSRTLREITPSVQAPNQTSP